MARHSRSGTARTLSEVRIWRRYYARITDDDPLEGQLTALLASAPDAMVIVDDGGSIIMANRLAELLFGYEHGELTGRGVDDLMPARFRHHHTVHRMAYMKCPEPRAMGP